MKKRDIKRTVFFSLLFGAYVGMTFFLFHEQCMLYENSYSSDNVAYISEIQGMSSGGEISYPVMFWIAELFCFFMTPNNALAVTLTCLNGLTFCVLIYWLDRLLNRGEEKCPDGWVSLLTFSLLLVSMLFPFHYIGRYRSLEEGFLIRYLGTFSPNPFHNATYLAARPFAVVTFFLAVEILQTYEQKDAWLRKETVLFSAMLLLTTLTKPSFTLILAGTCGVIMLWRLFRSRFKGMKAFWQFGIAFLPTFIVMIYQYFGMFTGEVYGSENGIVWSFLTAWRDKTDNVPRAILLATAFPLSVLLFQRKKGLKAPPFRFAWQLFGTALFTMVFLTEKGYRAGHMNFAWGYMYGLFFLFVTGAVVLVRETVRRGQPVWQLLTQWLLFGVHLVCGADYLCVLLRGGFYY